MGVMKLNDIEYSGNMDGSTVLGGTLLAGSDTITFTDPSITANSLIDVYSEIWYTAKTQTTGSCTITFPIQSTDMPVKINIH